MGQADWTDGTRLLFCAKDASGQAKSQNTVFQVAPIEFSAPVKSHDRVFPDQVYLDRVFPDRVCIDRVYLHPLKHVHSSCIYRYSFASPYHHYFRTNYWPPPVTSATLCSLHPLSWHNNASNYQSIMSDQTAETFADDRHSCLAFRHRTWPTTAVLSPMLVSGGCVPQWAEHALWRWCSAPLATEHSWLSPRTMEQSSITPERHWLIVQWIPAVVKDISVWTVGPRCSVNSINCANKKYLCRLKTVFPDYPN